MFLSNLRKSFLPAGLCIVVAQGCVPPATNEAAPVAPLVERKSGFPFSTKEPETYQGDIVINGREGDRTFVARRSDQWREDRFQDGQLWLSELFTDRRYSIDHQRKIYVEHEPAPGGVDSFAGIPHDMLNGSERYEFDEVARDNTITRYKVRSNKYIQDEILIDVDTASGMIVRQEFRPSADAPDKAGFVYEMRGLRLAVDDSIFALPAGYKKVTQEDLYKKP